MSEFDRLLEKRAVALQYSPDKDQAPVVVASGMGYMAERITEAAIKAGVPVYEDNSLASLLGQLKLGAAIPEELYQAIVDIYIYFLGYALDGTDENAEEKEGEDVSAENADGKSDKSADEETDANADAKTGKNAI